MVAGVPRALLAGLVDDAALFPPGNAPMDKALAEHVAARGTSRGDLVGPFVCPASRLTELRAHLPADGTVTVSLVVDTDESGTRSALSSVDTDDTVRLAGVEAAAARLDGAALGTVGAAIAARGATGWLEVPRTAFEDTLDRIGYGTGWSAAKYRTGGLTADAYPSESELAAFLVAAVGRRLPFKLTAGLHHAVRQTEPASGHEQHGVLNVLVATRVAQGGGSVDDVAVVLAQRAAEPLVELAATWDEDTCREVRSAFRSFGCCGVHDPLDDLAALGLLADDR